MTLAVLNVTFDSTDPDRLAQWWARALGGQVNPMAPGFFVTVSQPGSAAGLGFQKVDDPTPGKNRLHLDLGADDMEAEVTRLVELGATEKGRHSMGDFGWVVLADPDGNEFCVGSADHP
ncbi:glyoxalase [Mycobacterium sp. IS-1590]|uniref:VOC family protein n=1 Tax=Mycobacterium sp. IS-1590 TaxID=1772286 RepID=UPI0007474ED8|nr:VOC family protein [Mycobacterium sp. IS-1590]KUI43501.1 glyoxalase [Mycobacterium sp. IS-1590]